jgi:outer membrane protein TolC
MRLFRIFLALVGASTTLLAQTNAPEPRKMSLEDCIEIALQHNFDIQIKKYSPQFARYILGIDYGSYDPLLAASGEHDFAQSPGGIDQQGRPFGGTETDRNLVSAGLQGLLPWGMTYNLGGNVSDAYGTRPAVVTVPNGIATNSLVFLNNPGVTNIFLTQAFTNIAVRTPFEQVSGQVGVFQVRQPLLKNFWIDNVRFQILFDKRTLKISEEDLRFQIMVSLTAVETAYYNLVAAQENVKVQQQALQLAEELLAENKKRVEVGVLAPLDEKQAESQVAGSRADLLNALGTEDTQQRVLKALLSDDYSQWMKVTFQPTAALVAVPQRYELQESWRRGLRLRPDLIEQRLRVDQQNIRVRLQRNQLFPELDLFGAGGWNASSSGFNTALDQLGGRDNPFWTVGGSMTFPLGNRGARNSYKLAKETKEQMDLQLKQIEQNAMILIENDIAVVYTDYAKASATREAKIYAEAALEAAQKKLESGKSTSFEVLQLQKNLTQARSDEIKALSDYNNAQAQEALDEGGTLERRRIRIDVK